jgi:hypothetical protein
MTDTDLLNRWRGEHQRILTEEEYANRLPHKPSSVLCRVQRAGRRINTVNILVHGDGVPDTGEAV